MNRKVRTLALASIVAALASSQMVRADEPQAPPSTSAPAADSTAPQPASDAASTTAPAPGSAPAAASAGSGVTPGPLEPQRQELLGHIHTAGEHGIGTANYMMAFNAIEDQVKAGASETQIKPRVDSLNNALIEQLKRGAILKTQRPIPPAMPEPSAAPTGGPATAAAAAAPAGGAGGLAGLAGSLPPSLLEKLKDRLGGGDIPDSLKKQIPGDLLKKLGQ